VPNIALVAIPNDWRTKVSNFLIINKLSVLKASSFETALSIVESQKLSVIVVDIDWIISEEGTFTTLWDTIERNIPVLMLIHGKRNYDWLDKAYDPPLREYCRIPFSLNQLGAFMRRMGVFPE
jgi:DNA-binding NtrC family response regulator